MSLTVELLFPAFLKAGVHRPCFGLDAEDFHPVPSDVAALERARNACGGCAVRDACLATAMETRESGVWGGHLLVNGRIKG